ncbi:hypothetical protein JHFBIEKO_5644 [Methylobacterium mesophilicum]|nr:hypothetical protein JHFBIEKO_5644 [Methylobacterium mesophilicum]
MFWPMLAIALGFAGLGFRVGLFGAVVRYAQRV